MDSCIVRRLFLILIALCLICAGMAFSENYTASTMRLLRYEGDVEILDTSGDPRFVMEDVRFSSGETLKTGASSIASVSLDATKILTLDAETQVLFEKNGDHMVLDLIAGTLMLDVQEKLDVNESLDIRTSTMTVGVRGTILYVTTLDRVPERLSDLFAPADMPALDTDNTAPSELQEVLRHGADEQGGQISQLGVLQGTVHLSFTDEQGEGHSLYVSSGQKATLIDQNENDLVDTAPEVSDITPDDLEGFLEDTIIKDPEMYERIVDDTDDLLPPIAFFPESAEKVYDGLPLTCQRVKAVGLPEGYTYSCVFPDSQTNAGRCENTIFSYRVFNPMGKDVTASFQDIVIYPGTLTVYPAPLDITTSSETKKYDGIPLTNPEATVNGLTADETIDVIPDGIVNYVGTETNTYTIDWGETNPANYTVTDYLGILEVTPNDTLIRFTAGSSKKVYDGSALTNEYITVTGLPDIFTYWATTTGSQEKVGSSKNTVSYYQILDPEGVNVTACFSNISVYNGTLTVEPLELAFDLSGATVNAYGDLNIPNPSLTYMNGAHEGEIIYGMRTRSLTAGYNFTLFTGETVRLTVTAEETEEGNYRINGEATIPGSEDVSIKLSYIGETNIPKPKELMITTSSASKLYDGTPLTSSEVSVAGLADGDSITVTATGTITEIGTTENTYIIDWGDTDPGKYVLTDSLGTLEITANTASVTFTAVSSEKVYDGTVLTDNSITVSGLPTGFNYEATVTGSQTDVGESDNVITSYKILNEENIDVTANFTNIATVNGSLKVTPAEATVTTGSASKAYDGTPLTRDEASITGLASGETATVTATGSITDTGTVENGYTIDWGSTNKDNYTVTESLGTLEITVSTAEITFTATSSEKVYDGTALTDNSVTVSGLPTGFNYEATVTGSQTDVGESNNVIASYKILNEENTDVTANFTNIATVNGTLKVTPAEATVTTGSASKAYDGTPLIGEVTVTGLTEEDAAKVTATATGTITDVGSLENTYTIDWNGVNNANYTLNEEIGTLTIEPLQINIDARCNEGWSLSPYITFKNGPHAGETVLSEFTDKQVERYVMVHRYTFDPYTGDYPTIAMRRDRGKTAYTPSCNITRDSINKTNNYVVTYSNLNSNVKQKLYVTTSSDTKVFDGSALTGTATLTGLFEEDEGYVTVAATGTITDVGSTKSTYAIDWGELDSEAYEIVEELGTLTVTPLPLTISMSDYSYPYHGSYESTYPEVTSDNTDFTITRDEWSKVDPYTNWYINWGWGDVISFKVTAGRDVGAYSCSIQDVTAQGSAKLDNFQISYAGNPSTYTVQQMTIQAMLSDYSGLSRTYGEEAIPPRVRCMYWNSYYGGDYIDPDEVTYYSDHLDAYFTIFTGDKFTVSYSWADTGSGAHNVSFLCSVTLGNASNFKLYSNGYGYTITSAALNIKTPSLSKAYDGAPLEGGSATVTGLIDGDTITVNTASLTDVGSMSNTYTIDWGEVNSSNYTLTEEIGTLEVTLNDTPITVTANSFSEVYNGYMQGGWYGVTVEGVPEGIYYVSDPEIYWKDVGTYTLTPFIELYDKENKDVSSNFTNITLVPGTLTVTPAEAVITTGSASKIYDGTELTNSEASINGLVGEDAGKVAVTAIGSITDVGSVENTYAINWGEVNPDNYELTEELGTLEITRAELVGPDLTIVISDDRDVYNGQEQDGSDSVTVTFADETVYPDSASGTIGRTKYNYTLPDGGSFTLTVEGGGINVGEYPITGSVNFTNKSESDYSLSISNGTYTITPAPITIQTVSETKAYDGNPLPETTDTPHIIGTFYEPVEVNAATNVITDVGIAENPYEIVWGDANQGNYKITDELGTLKVTANNTPYTIWPEYGEKTYDGKPLTITDIMADGGVLSNFTISGTVILENVETGEQSSSMTNAGMGSSVISTYSIYDSNNKDVTAFFTNITKSENEWSIEKASVTLTSGSAEKDYDGSPLTNTEITVGGDGFAAGEGATYTVTGSQTEVGSSSNTFTYTLNSGTSENNYDIEIVEGLLTVHEDQNHDDQIYINTEAGNVTYHGNTYNYTDLESVRQYCLNSYGSMTSDQIIQNMLEMGLITPA